MCQGIRNQFLILLISLGRSECIIVYGDGTTTGGSARRKNEQAIVILLL